MVEPEPIIEDTPDEWLSTTSDYFPPSNRSRGGYGRGRGAKKVCMLRG